MGVQDYQVVDKHTVHLFACIQAKDLKPHYLKGIQHSVNVQAFYFLPNDNIKYWTS